jgi:hypothetical protein
MAGGGGRKTWSGDDAKVVSYLLSNIIFNFMDNVVYSVK